MFQYPVFIVDGERCRISEFAINSLEPTLRISLPLLYGNDHVIEYLMDHVQNPKGKGEMPEVSAFIRKADAPEFDGFKDFRIKSLTYNVVQSESINITIECNANKAVLPAGTMVEIDPKPARLLTWNDAIFSLNTGGGKVDGTQCRSFRLRYDHGKGATGTFRLIGETPESMEGPIVDIGYRSGVNLYCGHKAGKANMEKAWGVRFPTAAFQKSSTVINACIVEHEYQFWGHSSNTLVGYCDDVVPLENASLIIGS